MQGWSSRWAQDEPGVVRVGAHVKLVRGGEIEGALIEAFQDGLCVFSHVELWSTKKKGVMIGYVVLQQPLLVVHHG